MAKYYNLRMRCPACIAEGKPGGTIRQWYHANCGGRLKVGDNAFYKCSRCGHASHVKNWRYRCNGHGDYRRTSSAHLANAISTAGQLTNMAGRHWLMKFLDNLGDW
jgi:hypothetical protein